MVGLAKVDFQPKLMRVIVKATGDIVERIGTINLWLPRAEQVEIGAIEDIDERCVSQGVFQSIVLPKVAAGPYMWLTGKSETK
jgi:hypothetical protein